MSSSEQADTLQAEDDYTPHGYLHLPGRPGLGVLGEEPASGGVVRSSGVGYTWHVPGIESGYGPRRRRYSAGMSLEDARQVRATYHSSAVTVFESVHGAAGEPGVAVRSTWFLADDHTLCARLEALPGSEVSIRLDHERVLGAGGWGESGLVGRLDGRAVVLQAFESGEAVAFTTVGGDHAGPVWSSPAAGAARWPVDRSGADGDEGITVPGGTDETVALGASVRCRVPADGRAWIVLVRGPSRRAAEAVLARRSFAARLDEALVGCLADDASFLSGAPRLDGDWPAQWRRGVHYDLQTLRMMVRRPTGIYAHLGDAMQVQAPRTVLAEAAMDALALGRADPATAGAVLLGVLADAPEPNIPCTREDGSDTMVSAEGEACGTGPQWGLPFLVVEMLDALLDDHRWSEAVYDPLADYLDWWLTYRRDDEGWLVHACSWESGQDLSPRFGDQPLGGGHPTWHLRPVDLHAAAAHGARVLGNLAARHAPADVTRWGRVEADMTARVHAMWQRTRFADHDATRGTCTDVDDIMLLLPVALGVATPDQVHALGPVIAGLDADTLVWPMHAWVAVLAARHAGRTEAAGELAAAVIDRAYRHWDARDHEDGGTLPGVASEYWPHHGRRGAEAYGWGAFGTELLLEAVLGLRVDADGVMLEPVLPAVMRVSGQVYRVDLAVRGRRLGLELRPSEGSAVTVRGLGAECEAGPGRPVTRSWADLAVLPMSVRSETHVSLP